MTQEEGANRVRMLLGPMNGRVESEDKEGENSEIEDSQPEDSEDDTEGDTES